LTTFCLIHGSTQGPQGWQLLKSELIAAGHVVVTPAMPTNEPRAGAMQYAQAVADAVAASENTVLVAHSASGLFLPIAATLVHTAMMVFLAAAIPVPGTNFIDQLQPGPAAMLNPEWIGKDPIQDDDAARRFLFHDCPSSVATWALSTRVSWYPEGLYEEMCPMATWPEVPSAYVLCTGDRTIRPSWSRTAARERLGVRAIEIAGGHCPHVSRPADLAAVLLSLN
jgi:pimeloyl-ACP methyl ester carboxylesterase